MNQFLAKFRPVDVIAIILIIGGLILKYAGADGTVGSLLTAVAATYFGGSLAMSAVKSNSPVTNNDTMETYKPTPNNETVEECIRRIAKENNVDPDLAVRVAKAESSLQPTAYNENTTGSLDRGVFQWNNKYHPEITDECAFNVECATKAFCDAVNGGNLSWWNASKDKWDI